MTTAATPPAEAPAAPLFVPSEHDGGAPAPVPSRVAATWPAGHFVENLAVAPDGAVLISLHSHHRIDRYDPATGALAPWLDLPAAVGALVFDRAGTLWAVGGEIGQPPGQVWRIRDGSAEPWVEIPDALFVNGAALHPDGRRLLVADSILGRITAVDLDAPNGGAPNVTTWAADPRLVPERQGAPGANGVKVFGRAVYVSSTDRNLLLRAPIAADGTCGTLEVAADRLRADDFAFAASGALYAATHPANTVMRLGPDGARAALAGPAEGAVGTTAVAFADPAREPGVVYVTTNGGMWLPYEGRLEPAKLLRLEVGEPGAPLA